MPMKQEINELYLEWLMDLVMGREKTHYTELLGYLHSREFVWYIDMDSNRACDGIDLRSEFAEACGYDYRDIRGYLMGPCSVLEMMSALAFRCENNIMGDEEFGDRTTLWFEVMLKSLGLDEMSNHRFNEVKAEQIIDRMLYREYERNGKGGLFTIRNTKEDMRTVDIWYQLNFYLNENY